MNAAERERFFAEQETPGGEPVCQIRQAGPPARATSQREGQGSHGQGQAARVSRPDPSDIRRKAEQSKRRRQKKTETMRKLRAERRIKS